MKADTWHSSSPVRQAIYEEAVAAARKSRPDLFPKNALLLAGDVLAFGETKHPGQPWKTMTVDEHIAATWRHLLQAGTKDSESGLSHLRHALVRLAMAVELEAKQ